MKINTQMKLNCLECRKVITNRQHFLARKRTCKCGYSTRCKQASALHRLLNPCSSSPANSVRWPFGVPPPEEQQKQQNLLACSMCSFTSKSFEQIARHIGHCANHSSASIAIVATHVKIKLADQRAEHAEARLFGLMNMTNSAAMNQGRCNDDALYNQLKQMMRPDHAALALTNAHLSQKYLGSNGNDGNNTAEKRQEDSQQLLRLAFCNPEPMEKNKKAPSPVKLKASRVDNKRSENKRVAKVKETSKSDKNANKRVLGKKNLMREVL